MTLPIILLTTRIDYLLDSVIDALLADRFADTHLAILGPADAGKAVRRAASVSVLPADDECGAIERLTDLARRAGTRALLPVRTDETAFVARNREALEPARPVVVPDAALLKVVANKLHFARLMRSLGFPVPAFAPLGEGSDESAVPAYPLLVKPAVGEAGSGIERVENVRDLRSALARRGGADGELMAQELVAGDDVAITLLAERGDVFAVMMRRRWFTPSGRAVFAPMRDVEFFHDDWLEWMTRDFVRATAFSGIADFDLRVDFESRRAWFLECDPRMMGGVTSARLFGVNIPRLLVEKALGRWPDGLCARNEVGHFLSFPSAGEWLVRGEWRALRRGPVRMNWRSKLRGRWFG